MSTGMTAVRSASGRSGERLYRDYTDPIIGAAIEVHRLLGPGLLEETYESCLCHELHLRNVPFQRQIHLPIVYKGIRLASAYRIDLIVSDFVIVELKAVEQILPIHEAQTVDISATHRQTSRTSDQLQRCRTQEWNPPPCSVILGVTRWSRCLGGE